MTPTSAERKLAQYKRKRDFARTPEPAGAPKTTSPDGGRRFVVQRHRARRLHYDLRFEIGGVLASWAVPKGPTLDPSVKRAAVHVEDHPIEYADFEGVIPAGEYGGGDVIVWDRGTWEPHATDNPGKAVADGELHVDVHGEKLRGRLVLIRRDTDDAGKEQWILLHKHDEFAVDGWNPEDYPRSVISGRTNDEVKADPERLWRSDLPAAQASIDLRVNTGEVNDDELRELDHLKDAGAWEIFGRRLRVTNLDKVLFPGRGRERPVTKREFIKYAARIAPVVLPYLEGRALNMHRYPDGVDAKGFWHKQLPDHAPDWIGRWDNAEADPGETATYLVVNEPAALVWAANFGALEWHAWTSRADLPHCPTYALVDLDPSRIDIGLMMDMFSQYQDKIFKPDVEGLAESFAKLEPEPPYYDEWAACGIKRKMDIVKKFVPNFYFGCEAEDTSVAWAFNTIVIPKGILMPPAPGLTRQFYVRIELQWLTAVIAIVLGTVSALLATLFASYKRVRMPIGEALRSRV